MKKYFHDIIFFSAFSDTVDGELPHTNMSGGAKFNFQSLKEDHYGERRELLTSLMPSDHQGVGVFYK